MEQSLEHEIRHLAYDMWRSAEIGFGQALDFWVMAEQMVIELTADSVRRANTATTLAFENIAAWPGLRKYCSLAFRPACPLSLPHP